VPASISRLKKNSASIEKKVNVNAIALGHPLGATGARITATMLFELGRRNASYGIGSACIGGGQGSPLF
jgi:acetyl-CoA acetyltransferase